MRLVNIFISLTMNVRALESICVLIFVNLSSIFYVSQWETGLQLGSVHFVSM